MSDTTELVAELRNALTDWNGADIPDAELPRIDVLCGTLRRAADALEANARALAEAGAEIGRLRSELAEAKSAITEANNSLFGSQGYFLSLNGGAADKYHLSRAIEDMKASGRKSDRALLDAQEALKPFARLKLPWKPAGNAGAYSILFDDIRRAQSALDNRAVALADATPEKSTLSQDQEIAGLREEVRRKDERIGELVRVVRLYCGHDKLTDGLKIGALANHPYFSPLDGEA